MRRAFSSPMVLASLVFTLPGTGLRTNMINASFLIIFISTGDCPPATGTGSRRAAVTMLVQDDLPFIEGGKIEFLNVPNASTAHLKIKHLVEVAIVQVAVPAPRRRISTHQARPRSPLSA